MIPIIFCFSQSRKKEIMGITVYILKDDGSLDREMTGLFNVISFRTGSKVKRQIKNKKRRDKRKGETDIWFLSGE